MVVDEIRDWTGGAKSRNRFWVASSCSLELVPFMGFDVARAFEINFDKMRKANERSC